MIVRDIEVLRQDDSIEESVLLGEEKLRRVLLEFAAIFVAGGNKRWMSLNF